jgi:hypothetical protein
MKRSLLLLALAASALFALNSSDARKILELEPVTHHVQGIDTDGTHLWVTSVDSATRKGFLHEFLLENGRELRHVEVQEGDRFHAGGLAADRDSIWLPVAEYRANSSAVIQKRSKQTLALEFEFSVPDHIGCIAVTPEFIIGGNWDSRDFYFWDHAGKLIRKVASQSGNAYQDMKLNSGRIVASGGLPGAGGAIDWLELPSMRLEKRVTAGKTDRGASLTREAMTVFKDELWLLPEDNHSRLFVFPQKAIQ